MKKMIVLALSLMAVAAFGAQYKVEKVNTIGSMKHKVIYQSPSVIIDSKTNVMKGLVVARWGTERFEVVEATYYCNEKNLTCKYVDYSHMAMFTYCEVNANEVNCTGKISGAVDSSYSNDVVVNESPDIVYDEYDQDRNKDYHYPEFPVRIDDEYSDIQF